MTSYKDLGYATYPEYLQSRYWFDLKQRYIYKNRNAQCWISGKKKNLVLHHVNYDNMGKERLYKDVFIVTSRLHTWSHYYFYFFGKIPLNPHFLKSRLLFLKAIYCILKFNIILFVWYIVASAISLSKGLSVSTASSYKDSRAKTLA